MALVDAYGGDTMDAAVVSWLSSLDHVDKAIKTAEFEARENGQAVRPVHFQAAAASEVNARAKLRGLVRDAVRVAPRPRRAIRRLR
ncbi:hypothetical protein C5C31_14765 [Rathayibacter rathayi]|uniref:Uncharacterized protein n=2 Tax=Rathayibacter rathayi TaxID=33887 RepID=A0ABD6W9B6_RATRA|nr:hypothetical protein [Rathayibacter rathayi]AZZ49771.1 hypothetical protein C1O28_11750 [Rathayibacter rathayi]PPF14356.1 hypothetical protein C5C04_07090 [Rathayibacter rathayi]PPF22202.1 hypothetical protein C5C34_11995 [Rathayibacter rathayi]PPF46700.1 hypothetical protein C5C08_11155 [Rathayibacter rathayi]PPF78585.1 hypothetical protein C5C14_11080 [Rathayibacter rathayi]